MSRPLHEDDLRGVNARRGVKLWLTRSEADIKARLKDGLLERVRQRAAIAQRVVELPCELLRDDVVDRDVHPDRGRYVGDGVFRGASGVAGVEDH